MVFTSSIHGVITIYSSLFFNIQDYSTEVWWCDATLYDSLITMALGFLFVMVNWTAQLNTNKWYVSLIFGTMASGMTIALMQFSHFFSPAHFKPVVKMVQDFLVTL